MVKPIQNPPINLDDYGIPVKQKTAGRKGPGKRGGVYRYVDKAGTHYLMIKRETKKVTTAPYLATEKVTKNGRQVEETSLKATKDVAQPHKVMAELFGAKIMEALVPNAAPQTFFVRSNSSIRECTTGDNVYVASVYYKDYKSFHEYALRKYDENVSDDSRRSGQESVGFTKHKLRRELYDKDENGTYTQSKFPLFDEEIIVSVLMNDFDVISTNIGATPVKKVKRQPASGSVDSLASGLRAMLSGSEEDLTKIEENEETVLTEAALKEKNKHSTLRIDPNKTHTVRLDFGEALGRLDDEVHMHSHLRHPFGFGPTNHVREIPRSVKISQHFADAINRICSPSNCKRLHNAIDDAIEQLDEFYGHEPIAKFAKHTGMKDVDKIRTKQELLVQVRGYLHAKMERRMRSLKELESEIRMSLCFKRQYQGFFLKNMLKPEFTYDDKALLSLMVKDPLYFIRGNFHFRSKDQRLNIGPLKYRYSRPVTMMNGIVMGSLEILYNIAIGKAKDPLNPEKFIPGRPEVLEALQLNPVIFSQIKRNYQQLTEEKLKEDYDHVVLVSGQRMLDECRANALAMRNRIIEEILMEKSLPHRIKIVERYIAIFENSAKEYHLDPVIRAQQTALQRAIRAALHNPNIQRMVKTRQASSKLRNFYREQSVVLERIRQQNQHRPRVQDEPALNAKWSELSHGCEAPPLLEALTHSERRLFEKAKKQADPADETLVPVNSMNT